MSRLPTFFFVCRVGLCVVYKNILDKTVQVYLANESQYLSKSEPRAVNSFLKNKAKINTSLH